MFQGNLDHGWTGGDAAYTIELPNRRVLWSFGDSLIGEVEDQQRGETEHRFGNTVGVQSLDASALLPARPDFHWGAPGSGGWLPIFESTLDDSSAPPSVAAARAAGRGFIAWPLHGTSVGDDLALFHAPVTKSGCDSCGLFDFQLHGTTLSIVKGVDRPIDDWGATAEGWPEALRPEQAFVPFGSGDVWWGTAVLKEDSDVFVYGSREAVDGGRDVVVARISDVQRASGLLEYDRWQFWSDGGWVDDIAQATALVDSSVPEMTVVPLPEDRGGGYAFVSGGATALSGSLFVFVAPAPWGPFEERYELPLRDFLPHEETTDAFIYAIKAHAAFSTGGDDLLVSFIALPSDGLSGGGVPTDSRYYVPRFVRVPWDLVVAS
jgi:hypothetical protein